MDPTNYMRLSESTVSVSNEEWRGHSEVHMLAVLWLLRCWCMCICIGMPAPVCGAGLKLQAL